LQPFEIRNAFAVPFDYRVLFTDFVLRPDNPALADLLSPVGHAHSSRAVIFIDRGFHEANPAVITDAAAYFSAYPGRLKLAEPPVVVTGGETAKHDFAVFEQTVQVLRQAKLDRHSYAILIGGGAMLDACGFAAAAVHRGVRTIRIPTTVLAQNDAGIGVKNGIDFLGQKNFLGSFYPPYAVINDYTLLTSLPMPMKRDGHAEAVKVGLIRDAAFFEWIEQNTLPLSLGEEAQIRYAIRRCAEIHLKQITGAGDPFERGSARPLDFGHWAAHKLEQMSGFTLRHGRAVAIGMAIDVLYSVRTGMLPEADGQRVFRVLNGLGFDFNLGPIDVNVLLGGLAEFQEHLGGELCVTMLQAIGIGVEIGQIDMDLMRTCCDRILHP
jgi:3-dehydroquinate synthase